MTKRWGFPHCGVSATQGAVQCGRRALPARRHVRIIGFCWGFIVVSSDIPPPSDQDARRKRIIVAVILIGISLFMYFSFIIKTAVKGP